MQRFLSIVVLMIVMISCGATGVQAATPPQWLEKNPHDTVERYSLILFEYDSDALGPVNERILQEYVYKGIRPTSNVLVIGHADSLGLEERNQVLSKSRAENVAGRIRHNVRDYGTLRSVGAGEGSVYRGDTPEARFYSRTVLIEVRTRGE